MGVRVGECGEGGAGVSGYEDGGMDAGMIEKKGG